MKPPISKTSFLFLLIAIHLCNQAFSQTNWTFQKEKEGIKVYTRPSKTSKFNEIKAEFDVQTSMAKFISVTFDVDKYPLWTYGIKTSRLCERVSNEEIVYYSEVNAPWPFSNRDFYSKLKLSRDPSSKTITITAIGLPNYKPPVNGIVRIPYLHSDMVASEVNSSTLHVVYTTNVDAGGAVPAWLVNLFSTTGPIESFTNLKQRCKI